MEINYEEIIKDIKNLFFLKSFSLSNNNQASVLSKLEKVEFAFITDDVKKTYNADDSLIKGFYDDITNTVYISTKVTSKAGMVRCLAHELCHACSTAIASTGFKKISYERLEEDGYMPSSPLLSVMLRPTDNYVLKDGYRIFNEAATEYYSASFLERRAKNYLDFVPMYAFLEKNCDKDELINSYFASDVDKMISTIQKSFHLEDDSLIKKMIYLFEASFDINTKYVDEYLLEEAYKVLTEMTIQKLKFENPNITNGGLFDKIDLEDMLGVDYCETIGELLFTKKLVSDLKLFIVDYDGEMNNGNIEETEKVVFSFVYDKMTGKKEKMDEYKEYFSTHLTEAILVLKQGGDYEINGNSLEAFTPINLFLNFMQEKDKKIDLSKLSEKDKVFFMKNVVENRRTDTTIINPKDMFHDKDLELIGDGKTL